MAKADLAKLETALLKKIMSGSDVFRQKYSNYHQMIIHNSDKAIIKQANIQIYRREAYRSDKEFKAGLLARLGEKDGRKQYKAIKKIVKNMVPDFNKRVHASVKAESKKKNGKWIVKWLRKWPTSNHKFGIRKRQKGAEVFQAYKDEFKSKAQIPLIDAINAWSIHQNSNGQYNSRRGENFQGDDPESKRLQKSIGQYDKKSRRTKKTRRVITSKRITKKGDIDPISGQKSVSHDRFLDLGHQGQGVSGQRKLVARDFVESWPMDSASKDTGVAEALMLKLNASNKYKGELQKSLTCSWESASLNSATMSEAKNEVDFLKQELQKLVIELGKEIKGWNNAEASDSFNTMVEKTVINGIVSPLKRSKGVRTKTRLKVKKRKNSKTEHKGKKKKPRITSKVPAHSLPKLAAIIQATRSPKRSKSKTGPANAPLFLLGIFNKQLPNMVQDNMGEPALTNQTGRFAGSVRATDMVQTPQGFPSIGYTYQRDPYETFEKDSDYDPRKLIDRTMREIAAEYAIGRFYTRRV
tara:strand:+ start:152 stop:1726 length:1575 start_codon:yes stop_codon:yes gene_type:complete